MGASLVTKEDLQVFLIDQTEDDNFLLDDTEFTPEQLTSAMQLCIDKYNTTPPLIDIYLLENFPFRYELIMGAAAILLKMRAINLTRNRLDYTNKSGTAVQDKNKAAEYLAIAKDLSQEFDSRITKLKVQTNIENGYGSIGSAYSNGCWS